LVVLAACKLNFDDQPRGDGSIGGNDAQDDAAQLGLFGTPQLLAPVTVTGDPDMGPSIGANDLELYFTSTRVGGYTLWSSTRATPSATWPAPLRRAELDVTGPIEFDAEVTIDGLELYFGSNEVPNGVRVTTRTNTTDTWSAPSPLALGAMRTGVALYADDLRLMISPDEYGRASRTASWTQLRAHTMLTNLDYVTLSNSGLELYGVDSTQKLFRATRATIDDQFGTPEPYSLGAPFDTVMVADPELSRDARTLYFAAQVDADYDLYVATR
jgi:hypothetical protein